VRDNLLSRVDADGVKIEYSYDAANNRTAVKVPSGQTSYSFDEQNRLKTVTDPQAGVTTYTYDLAGNLIKTTLANGTTETREYDLLNRLLYLQNSNSSGVINSFRYSLDKVGNRLSVVEQDGSSTPLTTSRTLNYDYDALYRLLKEEIISDTTRTISYSYDAVSNRLTRNDSLEGNTVYEYDGNDRLLKEVTNGVTTTYTYDNNGNTLTKTVGTAKTTYEWDIENRLVGADTDGDGVNDVTNEYDGDGVRIRQTVAGEETRFLVDKNRDYAQVLEEYTPSKIIKASYIYGHDLISQLRDTERSFYHVDGLGSTRALTDINGLLTDAYAYEAFGEIIKQLGNTQNSYLFAGEQRDPNLGLDYLRARYLNVNTGRFYGRDPFKGLYRNPITLNKYIYAGNNPTNFTDPSGKFFGLLAPVSLAEIFSFYLPVALKGANLAATVFLMEPGFQVRQLGLELIMNGLDDFGRLLYEEGAKMIQSAVTIGEAGDKLISFGEAATGAINTSRAAIQFITKDPIVVNIIIVERRVQIQQLEIILGQAQSIIIRLTQSSMRVELNEVKILTQQLTNLLFEAGKFIGSVIIPPIVEKLLG
jgi:RHS repeat-associated protein